VHDISLKLDALGYISAAISLGISSTTFTRCAAETTEFGEITQNKGHYNVQAFKAIQGTNRKLIYDFLLVINSNLTPILHRFQDIAFDRSKIALFGYQGLLRLPPPPTEGGLNVPLRRSP